MKAITFGLELSTNSNWCCFNEEISSLRLGSKLKLVSVVDFRKFAPARVFLMKVFHFQFNLKKIQ